MIGYNDHHAAPEQIGENVPEGAVKYAQRNADQEGKQGFPTGQAPFLSRGKDVLQDMKKNNA